MINNSNIKRILGVVLFATFVFILFYFLSNVLTYIGVSVVVALVGRPIVNFLTGFKIKTLVVKRGVASGITLFLLLLLFTGFFYIVIPVLGEQIQLIANADTQHLVVAIEPVVTQIEGLLNDYDLSPSQSDIEKWKSQLLSLFSFSAIGSTFSGVLGVVADVVIALFSILFISFFFLKDADLMQNIFSSLTPDVHMEKMEKVKENAKKLLTRYFIGVCLQVTLITVLVSVGLKIIGIENALVIGFVAGLMNVIPYVGPLIGIFFGLTMAITGSLGMDLQSELLPVLGKTLLVFMVVQLLDNFIFQPLIFSNSVKAHPLEIFIVVLASGTLAGITGMVLAIPVYTIFRVVAAEFLTQYKVFDRLTENIDDINR